MLPVDEIQEIEEEFENRLTKYYNKFNQRSNGMLGILRTTIQRFSQERGPEGAAGIAFFTIFSLFPLLLVLVAIGSFVLESQVVQSQVVDLVRLAFPLNPDLITNNIQQVLEQRGSVGVLGVISLAWSATGAFGMLIRNIDRAWPKTDPRGFLQGRLVGLGLVAGLLALLFISSITATIIELLSQFSEPIFGSDFIQSFPTFGILTNIVPLVVSFFIFLGLYRWIPNTEVRWRAAFWAALVASIAWVITTNAFTFFFSSGVIQYQLIYGSLWSIVALMLWIYLNFLIILFCAHLSASIHRFLTPDAFLAGGQEDGSS